MSVSRMSKRGIQAVLHKDKYLQKGSNQLNLTCSGELYFLRAKMVRDDVPDCARVMREGEVEMEMTSQKMQEWTMTSRRYRRAREMVFAAHVLCGTAVCQDLRPLGHLVWAWLGWFESIYHLTKPKDRIGSAPLLTPLHGCAQLWRFTSSESAVSAPTLFTILPCRDQQSLCLTGVTVFPVTTCPSPSTTLLPFHLLELWSLPPFFPSFPFPLRVMASMSMGAAPLCSCPPLPAHCQKRLDGGTHCRVLGEGLGVHQRACPGCCLSVMMALLTMPRNASRDIGCSHCTTWSMYVRSSVPKSTCCTSFNFANILSCAKVL